MRIQDGMACSVVVHAFLFYAFESYNKVRES